MDASRVWKAGGVWPVETVPLFSCSSVLRVRPAAAEVSAIASVLKMPRAARFSIPLTILSDSQYALGVVLGEDRAFSSGLSGTERGTMLHATC